MSEILAPAGDKNSALAAINSGADAIYLGLKQFSARSSAENFDGESFKEIVKIARSFGVKVYVAMNTLVKESETEDFLDEILAVWNGGADAIILSDVFLGAFIKKNYPEIELHLSTQAGVCNAYGARFAKKAGFSRVILSRETAIDDIKEIAKIIQTEVFVQGALCTCFSGQCYFSSFAGGNSGNRGKCKQPCRKQYSIDRSGFEEHAYRFSLSDLSVGKDIQELISAGVYSFKIEGRMRRPEYVAASVCYYRNILNSGNVDGLSALKRTFNRGNYTKGLAFGQDKSFISSSVQGHIGEFLGIIKVENGKFICITDEKVAVGSGFKILRGGKEVGGASCIGMVKNGLILSASSRLKNGDKAFITTDIALNSELLSASRKLPVKIEGKFFKGAVPEISVNGIAFAGEKELSAAQTRPLTEGDIENCFRKVDKYPFEVSFGAIQTDGVFVAASELNALRRSIYEKYFDKISSNTNKAYTKSHKIPKINPEINQKTAVICTDLNGTAEMGIFKPNDYFNLDKKLLQNFKGSRFLYLPPYLSGGEIEKLKPIISEFDGIYCEGIYGFELAKELNKPLFAGVGLNISNSVDIYECDAEFIALSKEITISEAQSLQKNNAFYLAAGNIKVMDLVYCPFEKKCKSCDMRQTYTLTDENGRKFPLRRYKTGACRFEVYNCANLVTRAKNGVLIDCTLEKHPENIIKNCGNEAELVKMFPEFTHGHSVQSVR